MKIQLLFDSYAINDSFKTGWGAAFLVGEKVIFDTGEDANDLAHNLKIANIDLSKIETVVISHDHYDHTNGLRAILKANQNVLVYVPPNSRHTLKSEIKHLGAKVTETNEIVEIDHNIFIAKPMSFSYRNDALFEQFLVVKAKEGLVVITGCAHPGIISILQAVKTQFPGQTINLVIGGFHLHRESEETHERIVRQFKELLIKKVAPIHCTGKETQACFEKYYGSDYIDLKVGSIIDV